MMERADAVFPAATWRKSSYSGTQTECVEVAQTLDVVGVRDTKNRDRGVLLVSTTAWSAFTGQL